MYKLFFKRIFDFFCTLILLIVISPVFVVVCAILFFSNGGSIFFIQRRAGYKGRPFGIYKFKTMNDKRDTSGQLLDDDKRITAVGRFIRNTSLDELPQLLNVIKGNMSLIGPRPLLLDYLPLYNVEQLKRHDVKPGISGWAQVNGRNAITWAEKFKLDVWYVEHLSFILDIKIAFYTIVKVLRSKDVNAAKDVTMTRFMGNN